MASRYWTDGAGDGDFTNVNNWAATEGGASGQTQPTTGDSFWIQTSAHNITGVDTTVVYANVTITAPVGVGSAGTPLTFGATGTVRIRASKDIYIAAKGSGGNSIADIHIDQTNGCTVFLTAQTFTAVAVGANCSVNIGSSAVVVTLRSSGFDTIATNVTAITTYDKPAGVGDITSRTVTTLDLGGALTTKGSTALTTAKVQSNGKLYHLSSGNIGTSDVRPGGIGSGKASAYTITITSAIRWEGGSNFADAPGWTVSGETLIGPNT